MTTPVIETTSIIEFRERQMGGQSQWDDAKIAVFEHSRCAKSCSRSQLRTRRRGISYQPAYDVSFTVILRCARDDESFRRFAAIGIRRNHPDSGKFRSRGPDPRAALFAIPRQIRTAIRRIEQCHPQAAAAGFSRTDSRAKPPSPLMARAVADPRKREVARRRPSRQRGRLPFLAWPAAAATREPAKPKEARP